MIFLLGSILLSTKIKQVIHNCDSNQTNLGSYEKQSIDYQISCSNKNMQKINISNGKNIKSITVSKNSSVIIDCSLNFEDPNEINFIIYDNPKIIINNKCNFKSLTIYGTPIFEFSNNSILKFEKFALYNDTYKFPADSPSIIYSQKKPKKYSYSKQKINLTCPGFFEIVIGKKANITCRPKDVITLNYNEFSNYQINVDKDIIFRFTDYNESLYDHMQQIVPSINIRNYNNLIFSDLANAEQIESFFELFNSIEIPKFMTFTWEKYMEFSICPFEDGIPIDGEYREYYDLLEYLNYLDENTRWRKICISRNAYLFYLDEPHIDIIEIPKNAFLGLFISGSIIIILMIISFCIIGGYRYKKNH